MFFTASVKLLTELLKSLLFISQLLSINDLNYSFNTFCRKGDTKATGAYHSSRQPVVKKYNASDDASSFVHESPKGINKTGPRAIIVFLSNACIGWDMQCPVKHPWNSYFLNAKGKAKFI
jgi:hypothetical protein